MRARILPVLSEGMSTGDVRDPQTASQEVAKLQFDANQSFQLDAA